MSAKELTSRLFVEPGVATAEPVSGHVIRVALASAADSEFDYAVPEGLWPIEVGRRVLVPFGKGDKHETAFVVAAEVPAGEVYGAKNRAIKLKSVLKVVDEQPLLGAELLELARWISDYYVCPLGQVLAAMVPGAVKKAAGVKKRRHVYLAGAVETQDFGPACAGPGSPQRRRGSLHRGKAQAIAAFLAERGAVSAETAVDVSEVMEACGCKAPTIKRMAERQAVRIVEKKVLTDLPVVPKQFAKDTPEGGDATLVLNEDQQKALDHILGQIEGGKFSVTLLHGVTDSGKTELYIRAIEKVVANGKAAIVLLPEIALTAQTVQRFHARFERIAVMHSGLTPGQRNAQWQKARAGEVDVVIGARSAVFAPLPNLGLVVVDEEHEPSYKQDTVPRYHGRDVAIKRVQVAGAHCVLGTATPSLESLRNSQVRSTYALVRLPKRVMDLPMPTMRLVDMRQRGITAGPHDLLSVPLVERLHQVLDRKEQAILLLNRRGYSNLVFCSSCKYTLQCRNCDAALTFHKSPRPAAAMTTVTGRLMDYGYAMCHHCQAQTLVPRNCPLCGKPMTMIGVGSQRLEEEVAAKFPAARVRRVDSDAMAAQDYYGLLAEFGEGKIDVLAGTQILAKGLHFPNVTLVGVVSADTCLYLPDFRSNERTFQLISQVAGRAGRSEKPGIVFVQTYFPEQPAVKFALEQDFDGFVREELKHREICSLPPVWRLATIGMRDPKFEKLEVAAGKMREAVDRIVRAEGLQAKIRGPMPAVISRIQHFHRMQIVVQTPDATVMSRLFSRLRSAPPVRPAVKIAIDIDPMNLL